MRYCNLRLNGRLPCSQRWRAIQAPKNTPHVLHRPLLQQFSTPILSVAVNPVGGSHSKMYHFFLGSGTLCFRGTRSIQRDSNLGGMLTAHLRRDSRCLAARTLCPAVTDACWKKGKEIPHAVPSSATPHHPPSPGPPLPRTHPNICKLFETI